MRRTNILCGGIGLLAVACAGGRAEAAVVTVNNPSFEVDAQSADGGFTDVTIGGALTGWGYAIPGSGNAQGAAGVQNWTAGEFPTAAGNGVPTGGDGAQGLYVNNYTTGGTSAVFQNVGALLPNTTYTLTVAIGQRADRVNDRGTFSLINVATNDNTTNAGTVLATGLGVSAVSGTFQDFSTSFTTGSAVSGNLLINLAETNVGGIQAAFDNVRLSAVAVPEPAAIGLIGLVGCGLGRRSRR